MKEIGSREWWGELVTLWLVTVGGWAGLDRFYRGQVGWGVLKLITAGGALIWFLVDECRYLYRFGKTGQWEKSPIEVGAG